MNRFAVLGLALTGMTSVIVLPQDSYAQATYTGVVEQVWEDGFRLRTGDRTLMVDSWDVYGDNTATHVEVGDRITVSGEFSDGGFDAFSITDATL